MGMSLNLDIVFGIKFSRENVLKTLDISGDVFEDKYGSDLRELEWDLFKLEDYPIGFRAVDNEYIVLGIEPKAAETGYEENVEGYSHYEVLTEDVINYADFKTVKDFLLTKGFDIESEQPKLYVFSTCW